jgi:hypothetical protein
MTRGGVPTEVRRFIAAEIDSVGQLEVLMLLRGAPDKEWTPKEVARALVTQESSATAWLERMERRSLLTVSGGGYRYAPPTDAVAKAIDGLAESYAHYRVAVIGLIFSKPSEGVTLLSEAFRIRRRKD